MEGYILQETLKSVFKFRDFKSELQKNAIKTVHEDYLKLGKLKSRFPGVCWIALTATATPRVKEDILTSLSFDPVTTAEFKTQCYRPNLYYDVSFKELLEEPYDDLKSFAESALAEDHDKGSGIVYCRTRDACVEVASRLSRKGLISKPYHAGLKGGKREEVQQEWMDGKVAVICATISFGMGVDKANVRFIAHWNLPQSVEGYYQESGRAGRDGKQAYCRLYYSRSDRDQVCFLVKHGMKKRAKKSNSSIKNKAVEASFEAMVKYCEEPSCRHGKIASYFGDKKPECSKGCDSCKNPRFVSCQLEMWHKGVFAGKNKQDGGRAKTYISHGPVTDDDPELYGGGRKGYEIKHFEEDASDREQDNSDDEKNFRQKVVKNEFKKRKRAPSRSRSTSEPEAPSWDCPLKEASNFVHIRGLSVKARQHCFNIIQTALKDNAKECKDFDDLNVILHEAKQKAIDLEYEIFLKSKVHTTYRANVLKKANEIKDSTKKGLAYNPCQATATPVKKETQPRSIAEDTIYADDDELDDDDDIFSATTTGANSSLACSRSGMEAKKRTIKPSSFISALELASGSEYELDLLSDNNRYQQDSGSDIERKPVTTQKLKPAFVTARHMLSSSSTTNDSMSNSSGNTGCEASRRSSTKRNEIERTKPAEGKKPHKSSSHSSKLRTKRKNKTKSTSITRFFIRDMEQESTTNATSTMVSESGQTTHAALPVSSRVLSASPTLPTFTASSTSLKSSEKAERSSTSVGKRSIDTGHSSNLSKKLKLQFEQEMQQFDEFSNEIVEDELCYKNDFIEDDFQSVNHRNRDILGKTSGFVRASEVNERESYLLGENELSPSCNVDSHKSKGLHNHSVEFRIKTSSTETFQETGIHADYLPTMTTPSIAVKKPSSSKHLKTKTKSSTSSKGTVKHVADVVVKYLSPYLSDGRIANKDR
ncbi:hypothetical protein QZH41_009558 [Actinostola sp. cb2023]|nr:hypothetical protein QZH41_009558 [Actinostola sp. cb2023]